MNNEETYLKTGNLIHFFSAFLQTGSLSVNLIAGRPDEKMAAAVIYSIITCCVCLCTSFLSSFYQLTSV